ncbi:MAG: hypothetical protein FJY80_01330 [Candidatus Aminicenantes bacterium]|nr:hypothetical protein [Candidatus Aminicenantes bacterium]
MKRFVLTTAFALALSGVQYGQTLGFEAKIAHVGGGVRWSQCAFGPDGVLHVVFEEDTDGPGHPIWHVAFDGTKATDPFNVTNSMVIRGERPHVATSARGHVAVVWGVGPEKGVYMRLFDPRSKSWSPVESVKIGFGGWEPHCAVDADGNVFVSFYSEEEGRAYARCKINGVWEDTYRLSSGFGKSCRIAIGPNGVVWALWREKGVSAYKNYYSKRTKSTPWSAAQIVTTGGASSAHPHLTVGPDNVAVAAWGDVDPSVSGAEVRIIKIETGSPREIALPPYAYHFPRVAVDAKGVIHVAVQIGAGDYGDGLHYTHNAKGTWSGPQTIAATWPKLPGITADPFGNVAVCQSSFNFAIGGSDVWVYSIAKIEPRVFHVPLNPALGISVLRLRRNPEIQYTLSWSPNPQNKSEQIQGYNLYMKTGSGEYVSLTTVPASTLSTTLMFRDLNQRRAFAVATVGLGGVESDKVFFQ